MFHLLEMFLPQSVIKKLEKTEVICWNNGKREYVRFEKGKLVSFQVPLLITKINYPPNQNRNYGLTVYVHYIEYRVNQTIEKEKIQVHNLNDYKKIYDKVITEENFGEEVVRFYKNYQRRGEFKHARENGSYGRREKNPSNE